MISNGKDRMLVRKIIESGSFDSAPQFDKAGNIYVQQYSTNTDKLIIYGYSTAWLFHSNTQ
jgi:hypothetical protein